MSVNSDIEILLSSFERPRCLRRCLESIKKFTPDINVSVLDDSRGFDGYNMAKFEFGHKASRILHNSGIGPKRNLLLERCDSEFFIVMDDDCYFTEDTNFDKSVEILRNSDIDVLGLCLMDVFRGKHQDRPKQLRDITGWRHTFKIKGNKLYIDWQGLRGIEHGCEIVDALTNCFIAKTDRVKGEGVDWDPDLKLFEAWSFFFRAKDKLKIGYLSRKEGNCVIYHDKNDNDQDDYYKQFNPGQHDRYRKVMLDNIGVKEIIKRGKKGKRKFKRGKKAER